MLFRIEDISGFNPVSRKYNGDEIISKRIDKSKIDEFIANKIREEINGSKERKLLSYSKSLATCLLKYNNFVDNELHIYDNCDELDYIIYSTRNNIYGNKSYSIAQRIGGEPLFNKDGKIKLHHFIIDVSDNSLINAYLYKYTGKGKKTYSSPEKDNEVIVLNPKNDIVIYDYINSLYVLYALQYKYEFLSNQFIIKELINKICRLEDFRFSCFPLERDAIILIIKYLACYWEYEKAISKEIYEYSRNQERTSPYYDSIYQFIDIVKTDFDDAYANSDYNSNAICSLFWYYCKIYLQCK